VLSRVASLYTLVGMSRLADGNEAQPECSTRNRNYVINDADAAHVQYVLVCNRHVEELHRSVRCR